MADFRHLSLIVIHGWGGSLLEAAARVNDLLYVESLQQNGCFFVPRRQAALLRKLLQEPSDDAYVIALRKLIVSIFLNSPLIPRDTRKEHLQDHFTRFSEERLRQDFPAFGIPIAHASRRRRAAQLQAEAITVLTPILEVLNRLLDAFKSDPNADHSEAAVRRHLETLTQATHLHSSLLPLLEHLRTMHETGGDLDTVASAVLYAHGICDASRRHGHECRYGPDFRFVFVNYHESLRGLASFAPAELYLADLPIGAFPDLAEDIHYLQSQRVHTARLEDHHPYFQPQREALENCVRDGALGVLNLSGPLQGVEQPETEQKCAADMVYENTICDMLSDTAGASRLRDAAHGEDFVRNRTNLGILLTDLIKGGICKVELAQILLESIPNDDAMQRLTDRGWAALPKRWKAEMDATAETLTANVSQLTLASGGTTIIAALAVHAEPGHPKLPTGKAIEFLAQIFPDAKYVFYCFGSSLMVARRLDHADTTLNLGSLMPLIGTAADGGHAGAAVCRPDANPAYPARLLSSVSPSTFNRYAHYLADRLSAGGYPVSDVCNVSLTSHARWQNSSRRMLIILAIAMMLGLALIAMFPAFRPAAIRESNADFFSHISLEDDTPPAGGDDL